MSKDHYSSALQQPGRMLGIFFLIMFVVGTDTFLVAPLLPVLRSTFSVQTGMAGWMVSAYAVGYTMFALIAGPLTDGWDRKRVMTVGLLGFVIATGLCGFASGFWTMVAFRFLAGVFAAMTTPQIWAAIGTLLPPQSVVKGMGLVTAGLAVSQAIGVPVGSLLSGLGWRTPFWAVSAVAVLVVFFVIRWLPAIPPAQAAHVRLSAVLGRYRQLLAIRAAQLAFGAYFLMQFANFGRFSYLGIWMADHFHATETTIGLFMLWFGLGNLGGSLFGGRFVQRIGSTKVLLAGIGVLAVTAVIIPLCTSLVPIAFLWLCTSFCFGTVFPVIMAFLQSLAPALRGTVSTFASALMYGGSATGTWFTGWLYVHAGGFLAVSLMTAGGLAVTFALFERSQARHVRNVAKPGSTPVGARQA